MYRAPHWRIPRWNYIQPIIWGMTLSSLLTTTGKLMTRPTNRSRQRLLPPAKLRLMTPSQRSCELWHPATTPQSSKVRTTLQESLCWKSITYREAPRRECRPERKTGAYPLVPPTSHAETKDPDRPLPDRSARARDMDEESNVGAQPYNCAEFR